MKIVHKPWESVALKVVVLYISMNPHILGFNEKALFRVVCPDLWQSGSYQSTLIKHAILRFSHWVYKFHHLLDTKKMEFLNACLIVDAPYISNEAMNNFWWVVSCKTKDCDRSGSNVHM